MKILKLSFLAVPILLSEGLLSQRPYLRPGSENMKLSKLEKVVLKWFDNCLDSTKRDSAFFLSSTPFNWNDDTVFYDNEALYIKFQNWANWPPLIDSVFKRADSLKRFFSKSPQKKFQIVEIRFFMPNNLRSIISLVAINPRKKVIGFNWLGDFRNKKKRAGFTDIYR